MKLVCEQCGSDDVDILAWVNINTNLYTGDNGEDTAYCNVCEEEVDIMTEEEYSQKLKNQKIKHKNSFTSNV